MSDRMTLRRCVPSLRAVVGSRIRVALMEAAGPVRLSALARRVELPAGCAPTNAEQYVFQCLEPLLKDRSVVKVDRGVYCARECVKKEMGGLA